MSAESPDKAYRVAIGRAVLRARADNVPWKRIQQWFAYGRTRLWQFMCEAEEMDARSSNQGQNNVHPFTFSVHEQQACGQGAATRVLSKTS